MPVEGCGCPRLCCCCCCCWWELFLVHSALSHALVPSSVGFHFSWKSGYKFMVAPEPTVSPFPSLVPASMLLLLITRRPVSPVSELHCSVCVCVGRFALSPLASSSIACFTLSKNSSVPITTPILSTLGDR